MKLFIATCLKEYRDDVFKLFKEASMAVYSVTDITGIKEDNSPDLLQDWFASGDEKFDSIMIFCFTGEANARTAKGLIAKYNEKNKTDFPVRAFIVPVEE
ncbi:hypothetical protein [Mucilaginibacter ginsenosidivorans]|uniref:Uncharacterized protein n=1 Tax=Mucilaginibacter ginsenosidivorans TaxID=398053 RepID=A0A5B8UUV5_9SPHI|nr:hypothetical protein [Mucilaginibacter ginsenosidivorans]QEC62111.1 hypothetical protein FRZ54_05770 [Mucilaginibacter ginsenosidivorans]